MNEIEKLYKNAGVKSFKSCEFCQHKNVDCLKEIISNKTCGYSKDVYPPFTAEKKVNLLKWLSKSCTTIDCTDGEYEVYILTYDEEPINGFHDSLGEAIANCINRNWKYFEGEEREQIRSILNG